MLEIMETAPRFVFFTGKGGVGKTSISCMLATALADQGKKVLLISTDPASNLDEVLEADLGGIPSPVPGCDNLWAMNIDPVDAAERYKERIVGPYRGVLPEESVAAIEEQLSGACTVEIAAFNEFSGVIGDEKTVAEYDHVILDTAPTGHTLLLMDATEAYHREVEKNAEGVPPEVKDLLPRLRDPKFTKIFMVTLAQATPVHEARRLEEDLERAGIRTFGWIINQSFALSGTNDPVLAAHGLNELNYIREVQSNSNGRVAIFPWVPDQGDSKTGLTNPEELRM